MPRKGMRSLCFHARTESFSLASPSPSSTPSRRSVADAATDQIIESAAILITKWDPDSSPYANVTSLFHESKSEARHFLRRVSDLQQAMHFLLSDDSSAASEKLILAQSLMESAMKRLQKEFYQILSTNRAYLDPESVSTRSSRASARSSTSDFDDDDAATTDDGESVSEGEQVSTAAMEELRLIAECMISAGYAKECISIYKIIRKSIIDEGIYRLGVEKLSSSQVNKTDWEVLDLRIKNWLAAVKVAVRTLFNGERILCDHVFSASDSIRESCFADISREGALLLFGFPEALAAKAKKSPELVFRVLDMYTAIFENWPEIESIFAFDSTAAVRTQAYNSLVRIAEFVRAALADFEARIQKEPSKSPSSAAERGGGVHRLTVRSMNFLSLLADYSSVLADIFGDLPPPPTRSLPASFFDGGEESEDLQSSPAPVISVRVAWLILVLLCKLDGKAKRYDDVSVSYLFLANNLQHVVNKVRSSNLHYLLGEEWSEKHQVKVRQFAANYERFAWGDAIAALPEIPGVAEMSPEAAKAVFRSFNARFEEAYRKQRTSVVSDEKLREEIKASLARKLVAGYKDFYDKNRASVRANVKFAPEDVGNYLSDLFFPTTPMEDLEISSSSSSSSSAPSSPSTSARRRNWRLR